MDSRRKEEIEYQCRLLHREMLVNKALVKGSTPNPYLFIEPRTAAKHLGYSFEEFPELGRFGNQKERFEVAGIVDQPSQRLLTSMKFKEEERRFTAAHEIGHIWLHPALESQHRDRPVKSDRSDFYRRPELEKEADFFGACLLMPRRLLENTFQRLYGCELKRFQFTDSAAWRLCPSDPDSIIRPQPGSRTRALAIAGYRGGAYQSLARTFNVSNTAMAIRLEELGLCAEWP